MDMTNTSLTDHLYREDMLTMKPFSRHQRHIKVMCRKRGFFSFVRVNITTSDLLLLEKLHRDYPNSATLTILPELLDASALTTLLSITFSDIQQRRTLLTDPFAFSGIREYQPWDPMRAINWTATAKAGDFMVNEDASTSTRQVTIFLNLEFYNFKKSESLLEKSISLAYSYMHLLSRNGISSTLVTNGIDVLTDSPVFTGPSGSTEEMQRRGEDLARIDLKKETVPFDALLEAHIPATGHGDYIIVISPRADSKMRRILGDLRTIRPSLLWVMPCYKLTPDPEIEPELLPHYYRWETSGHD